MRFSAQVPDLRQALAGSEVQIARSVTAGMRQVTDGLKEDLREDVRRAGLGQRLANTWRGRTFPSSGESVEAAAYVSSNAPKLIDAFDRGVTILAKGRKYLAIPTPDAGVRQVSARRAKGSTGNGLTPAAWERETGVKLRFVPTRTGGVLVADAFYRRQAARFQRRKSFQPIREAGPAAGRLFVVIFVLVRQAKLRKRLDIDTVAQAWAERVPGAIAANWSV
ncbi:DUF6441 family protein [Methylobacterium nodulans]|uniref:Uncharacterized protein n=1 Tax=Methylobacterium nodulans (strain LMG 21967 / CNCM I-2342 / ORS 2060) TaxID=460265 RepID=B8IRP6_METNO|nr:DUF6441 family protein [Methylobacterium nodulans]ACL60596.1 conserved hypothetical protein [Methylobacterium nodulans ORS 2060]